MPCFSMAYLRLSSLGIQLSGIRDLAGVWGEVSLLTFFPLFNPSSSLSHCCRTAVAGGVAGGVALLSREA